MTANSDGRGGGGEDQPDAAHLDRTKPKCSVLWAKWQMETLWVMKMSAIKTFIVVYFWNDLCQMELMASWAVSALALCAKRPLLTCSTITPLLQTGHITETKEVIKTTHGIFLAANSPYLEYRKQGDFPLPKNVPLTPHLLLISSMLKSQQFPVYSECFSGRKNAITGRICHQGS